MSRRGDKEQASMGGAKVALTYENTITDVGDGDARDTSAILEEGVTVVRPTKAGDNRLVKGNDHGLDNLFVARSRMPSLQNRVYNFLERPTGWKCFIYHFLV